MSSYEDTGFAAPSEEAGRANEAAGRAPKPADRGVAGHAGGKLPQMLIVEDAPLIALDLAETMKDLGFHVRATAFTHEQALFEIRRSVPDFAVIDLHLGVTEDGLGGGETLLSMLDQGGCRCLIFSGDDEACRRVAARYPHFSVLEKPAQPRRLMREIERLREPGRP